jgi:hypothetical protein
MRPRIFSSASESRPRIADQNARVLKTRHKAVISRISFQERFLRRVSSSSSGSACACEWTLEIGRFRERDPATARLPFRAERLASSFARIGTPRLHACMPWTTHSFSTSMISAIVAPCRRRVLMRPPRLSRLLGRQHPRDALRRACLLRTAEEVRLR